MYIRQLPTDSATVAALRGGDQFREWSPEMYMLTNLLDAVQANTHAFIAANSKRRPKPPEPYERPKVQAQKKRSVFAAMARAQFMKNRKAQDGGS